MDMRKDNTAYWKQTSERDYWGASYTCTGCGKRVGRKHALMYRFCPICGRQIAGLIKMQGVDTPHA